MSASAPPDQHARALGWSRVALGAVFLVRTTPVLAFLHARELRGTVPLLGWPDDRWHGSPTLALPVAVVMALCVLRTLGALAFTLGVETRAAGLVAGVAGYLVLLQQPFGLAATLHLLFQGAILLALTDAGSAVALRPSAPRAPASGLLLIQLFVASIYAWAGIGKLRHDWLDGRTLEMLSSQRWLTGRVAGALLATPDRRALVAWAVVLTELTLGPLLLWPRTRRFGLALAVTFHVALQIMARPDVLGFAMVALLICFVPGTSPAQSASQPGAPAGHKTMP